LLTHLDPASSLAIGLLIFSFVLVIASEASDGFHAWTATQVRRLLKRLAKRLSPRASRARPAAILAAASPSRHTAPGAAERPAEEPSRAPCVVWVRGSHPPTLPPCHRGRKPPRQRWGLSFLTVARMAKLRNANVSPFPLAALRAAVEARRTRANKRAAEVAPVIAELWASGVTSVNGIAAARNERGIPTRAGSGPWYAALVARVLRRPPG
jgi:hypothetical protein